jgi:hypothetical protein
VLRFGGEEEGEQLMQILNSQDLQGRIIRKFDLRKHYRISTSTTHWRTRLAKEFKENIRFRRTEYMSIVIDVLDEDRFLAADIANEVSNQLDSVMSRIQHERAAYAYNVIRSEYEGMLRDIGTIQDSMKKISETDMVGFETDSKAYHAAYAKALISGKSQGAELLERKLKLIAKNGGIYSSLSIRVKEESKDLSQLYQRYRDAKVDMEQTIPYKFVVDKAYPSEIKETPKRLIIVVSTVLSTLFLTLVLLLIKDSIIKRLND